MKHSSDNVFSDSINVKDGEAALLKAFFTAHDYAPNSRKAIVHDIRKFAGWFAEANAEPYCSQRVATADVADFRRHLRHDFHQIRLLGHDFVDVLIDARHLIDARAD